MFDASLENLKIFDGLSPEKMDLFRPLFMRCDHALDDVIFEQGDLADSLYIIASGEISVLYKPDDGPELVVARVHPESVIGWSAALGSPLYTSSAVCLSASTLFRLRGEDLRWLCERHPQAGMELVERLALALADRLHRNYDQVVSLLKQSLNIALKKPATIKVPARKKRSKNRTAEVNPDGK